MGSMSKRVCRSAAQFPLFWPSPSRPCPALLPATAAALQLRLLQQVQPTSETQAQQREREALEARVQKEMRALRKKRQAELREAAEMNQRRVGVASL